MLLKLPALHSLSFCTVSFCKAICLFSMLSLATLSFSASSLNAEPLSKQACKDLREKHQKLLQLQAVQDMGKGFEWVKANSKPEEIKVIKQFIETEEQIKFRCPKQKKNKKKIVKPKKKPADLKNRPAPKSAVEKTNKKKLKPDDKKEKTTKKSPVKKKVAPKKKPQKPKTKPKQKTEKQPEPTLLDDLIATIQDAATPLPEEKKQ